MIGDIIDGNWKVEREWPDGSVELTNLYNEGRKVTIEKSGMERILGGKESVSSIVHRQLMKRRVPNHLGFFKGKAK